MTEKPIQPRGLLPKDLKNTLGRRPLTPIPSPQPEEVPAASPAEPTSRTQPGSQAAARDAEASGARPRSPRRRPHTVFYLPLDLSKELREFARSRNKTNADVIFDALESSLEELPQLLKPAAGGVDGDASQGVFTRTPAKPVGQKVQISGRIQDDNLTIIDRLVDQHGAESRSQLVEVALRAYLSTHTPVPAR